MNYAFSTGNGSDSHLFSHTGHLLHALFMADMGFEPVWMGRRRLALRCTLSVDRDDVHVHRNARRRRRILTGSNPTSAMKTFSDEQKTVLLFHMLQKGIVGSPKNFFNQIVLTCRHTLCLRIRFTTLNPRFNVLRLILRESQNIGMLAECLAGCLDISYSWHLG